ncbi:MAG: RpiB/LacA/LacB family sugar-phosphate isomerase [Candidatus Doudnabacteria bacterium]|nr:RpiB/LacA/LacB family sugar-phosphate isomerase [Candidatus Doudnabacteria bacterium]
MIYIASDHAGFELKNKIIAHLKGSNQAVEDCGPFKVDPDDDYPDFIYPCAQKVAQNPGSMGIVIGMSGQGEAIVANKVKGIRAALYYGGHEDIIKLSRQHNNSNILSLGARFLSVEQVERAIDLWIETGFDGGRHQRRIDKINALEK